ncbi:hypothetical protein GALMADRAFT_213432 [Galerina marginata CBS 339.88]|uniref:Uncharacterized protein n=1 Tax=Galerina marginata (strain CBS 339.88) TaxID=685588 RepID=A0A067SM44_GALM3|nr:hypothetical protein GALMADRAFT_213432 [Galerina marginata CBS 339.88]
MFDYNITLRGCMSYITESLGVSVQFNAHTGSTEADSDPSATLPLLTPPPRGVWVPSGGIEDFIRTLYQNILDRDPESQTVVNLWTGQTYRHGLAYTISGFFMSDEYTGRALPKEVTAEKFYLAVLGR